MNEVDIYTDTDTNTRSRSDNRISYCIKCSECVCKCACLNLYHISPHNFYGFTKQTNAIFMLQSHNNTFRLFILNWALGCIVCKLFSKITHSLPINMQFNGQVSNSMFLRIFLFVFFLCLFRSNICIVVAFNGKMVIKN